MTKICTKCKKSLSLDKFYSNKRFTDKKDFYCIPCRKECNLSSYIKNHSKRIETSRRYRCNNKFEIARRGHKSKNLKRGFVLEYLKNHPCADCGESDPIVLQFDHVRGEKKYTISEMIKTRMKIEYMIKEIDKCEVRCANCHTRKTLKGSYKDF